MRLYRKRRQWGLRTIQIPLHITEIDTLIRMGLLKENERQSAEALQTAVMTILYRELERAG